MDFVKAYHTSPIVRIGETTPELVNLTVRSIQLLNYVLPENFKLELDLTPKTPGVSYPPDGEIHIDFMPKSSWPTSRPSSVVGRTEWPIYRVDRTNPENTRFSARIFIDTAFTERSTEEHVLRMITHEFLHALGALGHYPVSHDPDGWRTLLVPSLNPRPSSSGDNILFWRDKWALFTIYNPYSPGEWTWETPMVRGCMNESICFGASVTMEHVEPWAWDRGKTPDTTLARNTEISGTVEWVGRLIGLTPSSEVVGSKAELEIDLITLDGQLDFTDMEFWSAKQSPGNVGTGRQWGDGDLNYGVEVRANTFIQNGEGDEGTITGIFAGASHEYMTGVIQRPDLGAGFGGGR